MRKFLSLTFAVIFSLTLAGCNNSSEKNNVKLLTIDDAEVPFKDGVNAVSDKLGKKYETFEKLDKADWNELCITLINDTSEEQIRTASYNVMEKDDNNKHDIKFFDDLNYICDLKELESKAGDYIISCDTAVGDYTVFVTDEGFAEPKKGDDENETYSKTMAYCRSKVKKEKSDYYAEVSINKTDDGKVKCDVFQIITKDK